MKKTKMPALEVMTRGRATRSKPACDLKSTARGKRNPAAGSESRSVPAPAPVDPDDLRTAVVLRVAVALFGAEPGTRAAVEFPSGRVLYLARTDGSVTLRNRKGEEYALTVPPPAEAGVKP